MKTLWAPWRLPYLLEASAAKRGESMKKKPTCIFCDAASGKPRVDNLVVHKGKLAYVVMNKYPYSNGHLMIIPRRHVSEIQKITRAEHAEMGELISRSAAALKKYAGCDGFNVGMNLGEAAGAGIKDHLHYHIVPRWHGDHNFMPILADARVVPEHLHETYAKLRALFSPPSPHP